MLNFQWMPFFRAVVLAFLFILTVLTIIKSKKSPEGAVWQKIKWIWMGIGDDIRNERNKKMKNIDNEIKIRQHSSMGIYSDAPDLFWNKNGINVSNQYETDQYGCIYTSIKQRQIATVYAWKIFTHYIWYFAKIIGISSVFGFISLLKKCQ
jgi:hypothetical protein